MTATVDIRNARIWTGWADKPWAQSLSIRDGRVTTLDEADGGEATVIDAAGRTITPGLIDAHLHLLAAGRALGQLDLASIRSREAFEEAIARRHDQLPPDRWLLASGWSQENWAGAEMPTRRWLAAAGDRPAVCYRMDMHAAVVNDAVLDRCDLSRPLTGGRVERDARTGEPTGLMIEAALWELVNPIVPASRDSEKREALRAAQARGHELGLTAVGTMEYRDDVHRIFEPMREELSLRCRVTLLDRAWPMEFDYGRAFANDDRLAVIGYKAFADGTLGSQTARLLDDYADDPGNRGLFVELAADGHLEDWARGVIEAGLSPSVHAIGDEAVRCVLDVCDALGPRASRGATRLRLEHAQLVDPADVPRCRDLIVSMQPTHRADDGRYALRQLGPGRLDRFYPFRSLREAGAKLAFGSDWPVVSCDPLAGIRSAVTALTKDGQRFLPDETIGVEEALRAYTAGAAEALQLHEAGVLRPGAPADLVMFDTDPFTADWVDRPPRVLLTMVGGRIVHRRQPNAAGV
ncbi:MAG: amidohydrolase [Planctomycetota bacterium]|nr:amidohydrolase [Planctomycetota bacterium]